MAAKYFDLENATFFRWKDRPQSWDTFVSDVRQQQHSASITVLITCGQICEAMPIYVGYENGWPLWAYLKRNVDTVYYCNKRKARDEAEASIENSPVPQLRTSQPPGSHFHVLRMNQFAARSSASVRNSPSRSRVVTRSSRAIMPVVVITHPAQGRLTSDVVLFDRHGLPYNQSLDAEHGIISQPLSTPSSQGSFASGASQITSVDDGVQCIW